MDPRISPEEQELLKQLDNYRGEWVAVDDNKVVAHAEKFGDLIDDPALKESQACVFKVLEDPNMVCIY